MKKHITILGGGNGGSISIRAMKHFLNYYDISAIVPMSDSGSSSGQLRKEFGVLPPGDILRAILAMSRYDYDMMKRIFYDTRYSKHGKLKGFGLGHLFIAFVEKYNGNIVDAIRPLAQAVDVVGPVFPVTKENSDLCVELDNGEIIIGEHEIDRPIWERTKKIHRAFLQPTPMLYERTRQELLDADVIIIGPGSFFTSIIATLLPEGMKDTLRESKARIIFVPGSCVEIDGETGPETLSAMVNILHTYLPRTVDVVLANVAELDDIQKTYYQEKKWKQINMDVEHITDVDVMVENFELACGGFDPKKLGTIIHTWIEK